MSYLRSRCTTFSDMDTVQVRKEELLEKITVNKEAHRSLFIEAQEGFRKAAIELLEARLSAAKDKRAFQLRISIPEPEDHTSDYERAILMIVMEVGDLITLSESDFARYVMDDWGWRDAFIATASNYTGRKK